MAQSRLAEQRISLVFFFPSICVHPCDVELLPFHTKIWSGLLHDPDVCLVLSFPAESHGDTGRGRGTVSGSTQSSELSTPSSLYMEYGEYSEPESGCLLLVMHCRALLAWVCTTHGRAPVKHESIWWQPEEPRGFRALSDLLLHV